MRASFLSVNTIHALFTNGYTQQKKGNTMEFNEQATSSLIKHARIVARNIKGKTIYTTRTLDFIESCGTPDGYKALYFVPQTTEAWAAFVGFLRHAQDTMNINFMSEDVRLFMKTNVRLNGQKYSIEVAIEDLKQSPFFIDGLTMSGAKLDELVAGAQERANQKTTIIMDRKKRRELLRRKEKLSNILG